MYTLQKFPLHVKCVTTPPCEIWILKIATELAFMIQSKVNRTHWYKLWVKFTYFSMGVQCYSLLNMIVSYRIVSYRHCGRRL